MPAPRRISYRTLAAGAALLLCAGTAQAQSRILRVGVDGDHPSLSSALAAANPHDTIRLAPGVYAEGLLTVDRPVTLTGEPGVVLDGEGKTGLLDIVADSVTVRGLTFRNTGTTFADDRAALKVEQARFCTVADNRFENTFFGIYLANAADCRVEGNVLETRADRETAGGNGIHLWYSTRILISGNRIRGHRDGIYFEFVEDSEVVENVSRENLRYGLHFMFSDDCAYRGNTFAQNGAGVAVMYTEGIVMEGNDFDDNRGSASFGLLMKDITDSRLEGNRFRRNSVGIHAEGASRLIVRRNQFVDNGWAVKLMANSEGSVFEANNFVGNTFDVSTNSRRGYSGFRGNFWDRYRGYDLDRDGVGDEPFQPVRLFSLIVEQNEPALVLQRSFLVTLLDLAETVIPLLSPRELEDPSPSLRPLENRWSAS